jgi:hypothetical protein
MAEMERRTILPPSNEEYSLTGDAIDRAQIEGGGVGTAPSPDRGMKRYPTEDAVSDAASAWRRSWGWSALGAAAGAGAALLWKRRARGRRFDDQD